MNDIASGVLVTLVLSILFVLGGHKLARLRSAPWLLGASILFAMGYVFFVQDRLWLAKMVPHPLIVVLGQALLFPLSCGIAALAAPRLPRRWLLAPLLIGALYQAAGGFFGRPPDTSDTPMPNDGIVRQTSESSCSAASAASILAHAGIRATETELARLSLTRSSGTPMLGVYRGLRQKTAGTNWGVSVLSRATLSELREACQSGPVLLSVGLDRWQRGYDPRYVTEWGWTPGKRHAVVLFGFLPEGKIDIGDPSVGREKWDEKALTVLWNGEGLQLKPAR